MLQGLTPGFVEIQTVCLSFDMYDNMYVFVHKCAQLETDNAFLCNFTAWF